MHRIKGCLGLDKITIRIIAKSKENVILLIIVND